MTLYPCPRCGRAPAVSARADRSGTLWTASCFWNDPIQFHPYYCFDLLLTLSFPFFLPAARKAVTA